MPKVAVKEVEIGKPVWESENGYWELRETAPDEQGRPQLFVVSIKSDRPRVLTLWESRTTWGTIRYFIHSSAPGVPVYVLSQAKRMLREKVKA